MPKAAKSEKIMFYGTGRRKKSIARVRLVEGKGNIIINGKPMDEYFGLETLKVIVKQPLTASIIAFSGLFSIITLAGTSFIPPTYPE